jgi:hypothetical protein
MKHLGFALLLVLILCLPANATGNWMYISDTDPLWASVSQYIPVDSYSVAGLTHDGIGNTFIAVRYTENLREQGYQRFEDTYYPANINRPSQNLIVAVLQGTFLEQVEYIDTPTDLGTPWTFEKVKFATLHDGTQRVDVLVTIGYEESRDHAGREHMVYSVNAYTISMPFMEVRELRWDPEPYFPVETTADFVIDQTGNGIILWMHDTESIHDGPYQVSQMLYGLGDGVLTETRHETTGEFYEELPSMPPIGW